MLFDLQKVFIQLSFDVFFEHNWHTVLMHETYDYLLLLYVSAYKITKYLCFLCFVI